MSHNTNPVPKIGMRIESLITGDQFVVSSVSDDFIYIKNPSPIWDTERPIQIHKSNLNNYKEVN